MHWLESLALDLRYGARSLARERSTTAAVVGMLALGIGANVAIFTLLNAIWLRPLPYRDAGRLVARHRIVSTCVGLIAGVLVSAAAGRVLNSLVRIDGVDAQTLAIAAVIYFAIAVVATYVPARRAFSLDTARALGSI